MLNTLGRVGGRGGAGSSPFFGARLVQPGAIAGGSVVTFSRSQVSSFSTATNATGSLVEYAADVPRFNGSSTRLLIEGQRTNSLRNPRLEGGVAGSPGTYPTNVSRPTTLRGCTQTLIFPGATSGHTPMDWALSGTATSAGSIALNM